MKVLIIGAGNLLLSDEGFGVHFIRFLEETFLFSEEVELLDAGTMGILAAPRIEEAERVYIIDSLAVAGKPGECLRYAKQDIMLQRIPVKLSPHQAGVQEMLLVSELRGLCPQEVTLMGVIPASFEPGSELTPALRQRLRPLAEELVAELRDAGISVTPKQGNASKS